MNRARFSLAATLAASALSMGVLAAGQAAPQAPEMKSVLAGKKLTPPARGEVQVEYTGPNLKASGDMILTTFQVKNLATAPIARMTVTQTWYDKGGAVVGGGKGSVNGLLQPGEVQTITVESPKKEIYARDQYNFTHANGNVQAKRSTKPLVSGMAPAAAAAPATPAKK